MARRTLIVVGLALLFAAPAAGTGITGQKESIDSRISSLHDRAAQAQQQESALRAQIDDVTQRIRSLERRVGDVSTRLATLEHDLVLHRRRLARLTALYRLETRQYAFLRRQYVAAVHRLAARLVEVYESGDTSTLDVLLSATSLSDALDDVDRVNEIEHQDRHIVVGVGRAKLDVRRQRERTKVARAGVAGETRAIAVRTEQVRFVRQRLLASRRTLSSTRSQQQSQLAVVTASERRYAGEAAALARVSAALAVRIQAAQATAATPTSSSSSTGSGAVSSSGLIWPVNGPVVSPFGMRWGRMHTGIDIAVPYGTPIKAAAAGTVIYAAWMSGYGNFVIIDHGGGLATAYAHQSSIAVANGARVEQGQVIGYVGCTGHCFGPHLHFEVRVNGTPVDPLGYL
jgi:murein DD-endopeptidase MepM/ murein hydrolase activator NlpD